MSVGLKLGVGTRADAIKTLLEAYTATVISPQGLTPESQLAELKKADLVLVEKQLHRVPGDDSGRNIAESFHRENRPVVLMVGSEPNDEVDFDLLRTGAIDGLINRSLAAREWPPCVAAYRTGGRFPNCVAQIRLLGDKDGELLPVWEEMRDAFGMAGDHTVSDECCVLLRRLIAPCATDVILRKILGGQSGAKIFRAKVSFGDGPMAEDLAVKYGHREKIRREAMHYDRFVGPLPDGVATQLRWRSETERFGALAYSWVGDSVEDGVPLGPVTEKSSPVQWARRQTTIDRLFRVSLSPWYEAFRGGKGISNRTLHDLYASDVGIFGEVVEFGVGKAAPLVDTSESYVDTHDSGFWVFALEDGVKRRNPITWARRGFASKIGPNHLAPAHGDLHVKNVYVLPDNSPRLIDFGDTGVHHLFRDFAALEASVRLTCVKDKDLRALSAMEKRVNDTRDLYASIPLDGLGGSRDLREALRTTEIIRKAAQEACGYHGQPETNLLEYLYAVVVHMLRYAAGKADELGPDRREREGVRIWHAMYAAALATERALELEDAVKGKLR
jgi:Ternary complex associated domain 9